MNLARLITFNSIISLIARICGSLIAIVILGLSTRYLSQAQFGFYSIIWAYVSIFAVLADLGLYSILTRDISKNGADEKKIIGNIFTFKLFISVIFFILSLAILFFLPYQKEARTGGLIIVWALFFLSLPQVLIGVFQKYFKMFWVAFAEIGGRIVQLALTLAVIKFNLGFYWFLATVSLAAFFQFLIIYFASKRIIRFNLEWDFNFWKSILKTSLPLGASAVVIFLYFKFSILLLSFFKSESEVALYGLAYKFLETAIFFPAVITGLILPLMSNYFISNFEKFKIIFCKTAQVLIIFGMPLLLGGIYFSDKVIILLGGEQYLPASNALKFLTAACFFIFFGTLFNNAIVAAHRQSALIKIYGIAAVFNIILNLLLIPKYSYNGVAFAALLTEFLVAALMFVMVNKYIDYASTFKIFVKSALASLIMLLVLINIRNFNIVIIGLVGFIIYAGLIVLFKAVRKDEINLILNN